MKKTCFVIMGYGPKADYPTGRTLDLDKTYYNLIKPTVENCGLNCRRADEIRHSGIIDVPMFEQILTADIVIADLSTYNPNAFYELGVRHALKPYTTIAIAEKELKNPFDVSHTVIMRYEHLGKDIGVSEAKRFKKELKALIKVILRLPKTDSPVYTYINNLIPPSLRKVKKTGSKKVSVSSLRVLVDSALAAKNASDFDTAKKLFQRVSVIDKGNPFIVQQLALATYKSAKPSVCKSLNSALKILTTLKPDSSTDSETLGLAGAIYKRLWEETHRILYLSKSIAYYERGFYIKNDYYNGINVAYLLNVRSSISKGNEAIADYALANRIRRQVVEICKKLMKNNFKSRSDQYWIVATLEETYFGLQNMSEYKKASIKAKKLAKAKWERQSTEEQIKKLNKLLLMFPRRKKK
jgi:hypothetical protein